MEVFKMVALVVCLALISVLLVAAAGFADEQAEGESAANVRALKAKQNQVDRAVTFLTEKSRLQGEKSELSRSRSAARDAYETKLREATETDPDGAALVAQMKEIETQMNTLDEQRRALKDQREELEDRLEVLQAGLADEELTKLKTEYENAQSAYAAKKDEIRSLEDNFASEDSNGDDMLIKILSDLSAYMANL